MALEERIVEFDEGQTGSNPGKTPESRPPPKLELKEEDQAGSDPGQSHVAQAGPNPEPMHKEFIATVYPKVHESLKLTTEEQVYLENPLSSSGTLSSMKNLEDDKTTQDLAFEVYKLENHDLYSKIDKQVNEVVKEVVHNDLQAPLRECFRGLSEFQMKEILHDRMFESNSYRSHPDHITLYEALEVFMQRENNDELHASLTKSHKRRRDDQDPPPPPLKDSDRSKKKKHDYDVSASKQPPVQKSSPWKTSNLREAPSSSSKQKHASPFEQPVNDDLIPKVMHLSESEDTGAAHLSKIKTRPDWLTPLPEEETPKTPEPDWVIPPIELLETENNWADAMAKTYKDPEENKLLRKTRDMTYFIHWYCKQIGKKKLVKSDFEDQIGLINPEGNRVIHDMSKPLPLGVPAGQITIQAQYFFNKDLEYLVSGNKERRHALSISKLKAAYYPDFGLKELVLSLWTESESDYDISSAYDISHWWFKSKEFYITSHNAPSDRNAIRSHIKILSVFSLKTYSRYGKLNHLSGADKVHLSTAVNLWTRNIVIRQRVEDLQLGTESYQTKLNITQPSWDATDFLFKEDYTILDYMVKDYELYKYNPGMENRIWNDDDKQRSQEFIKLIKRRLKIRRIFRSLKSFVSGRIRDIDYRLIERTE
ncbi:hypothetical protein Tco_0750801 [Tanacetum coccineum]|uniref:Uncharacterized protein n=1 Tax=Tanacetum coccineum TaxID=301880 RepID=A0ABQ4Z370_9ASTR